MTLQRIVTLFKKPPLFAQVFEKFDPLMIPWLCNTAFDNIKACSSKTSGSLIRGPVCSIAKLVAKSYRSVDILGLRPRPSFLDPLLS